jgi:hypothetical protein
MLVLEKLLINILLFSVEEIYDDEITININKVKKGMPRPISLHDQI